MKVRYIVGLGIAIVFVVVALLSFNSSSIEYSNFGPAKTSGKKVQVIGQWVKEKPTAYDASKNQFSFYMKDKDNREALVLLNGPKPNNFDLAVYFVVTGRYSDNDFVASDILTKCPSKYEGTIQDMKQYQ